MSSTATPLLAKEGLMVPLLMLLACPVWSCGSEHAVASLLATFLVKDKAGMLLECPQGRCHSCGCLAVCVCGVLLMYYMTHTVLAVST